MKYDAGLLIHFLMECSIVMKTTSFSYWQYFILDKRRNGGRIYHAHNKTHQRAPAARTTTFLLPLCSSVSTQGDIAGAYDDLLAQEGYQSFNWAAYEHSERWERGPRHLTPSSLPFIHGSTMLMWMWFRYDRHFCGYELLGQLRLAANSFPRHCHMHKVASNRCVLHVLSWFCNELQ